MMRIFLTTLKITERERMLNSILTILMIILVLYSIYVTRKWHKVANKIERLVDSSYEIGGQKDDKKR